MRWLTGIVALLIVLSACNAGFTGDNENPDVNNDAGEIRIALVADGERRVFAYDRAISVGEFLDEIGFELSTEDRIEPPRFTLLRDGMTITIVRVEERSECRRETLQFNVTRIPRPDLEPGEFIIAEPGQNGEEEICERVIYEDGVERSRTFQNRFIIEEPQNEVVFYGVIDELEPVSIDGSLAYISGGQAYIIRNINTNIRPLTVEGGLDGRVFDLSPNGRQLLFTRQTSDETDPPFANELWVVLDTVEGDPIQLSLTNILAAQWMPGNPYTISYTTARPEGGTGGWNAYNDLFVVPINDKTGEVLDTAEIVPENFIGLYAYWGTRFAWSPDGSRLAYAKADGVGLVDLETGEFGEYILEFAHYGLAIQNDWVWQPQIEWSQDSNWVITTVHGAPYGAESPVDSIVFNVAVFQSDGAVVLDTLLEQAGIWASPRYSPIQIDAEGFPEFQISYLQARSPLRSYGAEYDLVVVDRDGSNPRVLFPGEGQTGLRPVNQRALQSTGCFDGDYTWSPSGEQIAIIYQCNLWVVDVQTGLAQQVTGDGRSSSPVWMQ